MRNLANLKHLARGLTCGLLDLIYPPKCLICDAFQPHYLCPDCIRCINMLGPMVCRRCGASIDTGLCRECRGRELYFDTARSVAVYENVLRDAIHILKYSGQSCLIPDLANLMVDFCNDRALSGPVRFTDAVIPVPIDSLRKLERGFSQSEMLADYVAIALGKPMMANIVTRTRRTAPQSSLSYEERLVNLQGVFAVTDPAAIIDKKLLVIDDVYTTGSTANEVAKVLKEAGAREVHVFTLARSL